MSFSRQSRPNSVEEGAAFPWLLEHIISYPGTYEIPLRTMYTLNSSPHAQPLPPPFLSRPETPASPTSSSATSSPTSATFPPEQQNAAALASNAHFKSSLMTQIAQLPSQPVSLPVAFISGFVRRCFVCEYGNVDFSQALTALDYLRDLENRRRKEMKLVLVRLGVDSQILTVGTDKSLQKYPGVLSWLESIEGKEKKLESLYTQAMIHEMGLDPFNKANCVAMLNTLYPPSLASNPTPQLTVAMLLEQRTGFFRYIQGVSRNGRQILENLILQGRRVSQGDVNGWPGVADVIDQYLRLANSVILECQSLTGVRSFEPETEEEMRRRKVDSGVSFGSRDRPSTSSSNSSKSKEKPLPASPALRSAKSGTTLEKIAREIRRIKSRHQINEIVKKDKKEEAKPIKKMKSLGNLSDGKGSSTRLGAQTPAFNADEMRRERLLYDARMRKTSNGQSAPGMNFEV
ncbi:MAG: hypothetical protein M1835_000421 [Candelina submexicana]|nr:MAG: hypothetical protein M1835_000421 [Candelina submexicana]